LRFAHHSEKFYYNLQSTRGARVAHTARDIDNLAD